MRINITTQENKYSQYSNGFATTVKGESISYHGSHPEVDKALLIRCRKEMNHIIWKTDEIPTDEYGYCHLVWLGGLAGNMGGPHSFELYADQQKLLDIQTTALNEKPLSEFRGELDSSLQYQHQLTDMCKDHFGLFLLKFKPEKRIDKHLTLELKTTAIGSEDWLMIFEYPFSLIPKVHQEPVLIKKDKILFQRIRLTLDSLYDQGSLSVLDKNIDFNTSLHFGFNQINLELPVNKEPYELTFETFINNQSLSILKEMIQPVTPRSVYLLPYSHNDIGYTALQTRVAEIQKENIYKALDLIDQTADNPPDSVNRWNLEVIWILESWWQEANENDRARFKKAVKKGYIGLNALYANPLTGLCNLAEIHHHFDMAHRMAEILDINIITATVTDIPGFVWSLCPALAHNGVRYFSIAPNNGDRVGFIYEGLGDKPFWWVSPSGTEKVLTWVAGAGYAQFHKEKITGNGIRKMISYLKELEQKNYPYEIVALPYTIGGDNGGPDEALADFVKNWDKEVYSPKLIISTHEALFQNFEQKYGNSLPELKGDMTPYWEDGAMSTAIETLNVRRRSSRLRLLDSLFSLTRQPVNLEFIQKGWDNVVLWDEHTWGAWNSVSDPDNEFVKKQWEIKKSFAESFNDLSQFVLSKNQMYLFELNVRNPFSFPVQLCIALPDSLPDSFVCTHIQARLKIEKHGKDKYIKLDFRNPFEHKKIVFYKTEEEEYPEVFTKKNFNGIYKNKQFIACFDLQNGSITSLIKRSTNTEMIEENRSLGLLLYILERKIDEPFTPTVCTTEPVSKGKFFDQIIIHAQLKGTNMITLKYNFYHESPQIDLNIFIDKMPVRKTESLHLAFPFNLKNGIIRYDSAGAPVELEKDQLPGMCRNFLSPTSYIDISEPDSGVTLALTDCPLVETGGLTAEMKWLKKALPGKDIYAYLMNNIWHTNYKADQEGECSFNFSLLFHDGFSHLQSFVFAEKNRLKPLFINNQLDDLSRRNYQIPLFPLMIIYQKNVKGKILVLVLNPTENEVIWDLMYTYKTTYESNSSGDQEKTVTKIIFKPYQQKWILYKDFNSSLSDFLNK